MTPEDKDILTPVDKDAMNYKFDLGMQQVKSRGRGRITMLKDRHHTNQELQMLHMFDNKKVKITPKIIEIATQHHMKQSVYMYLASIDLVTTIYFICSPSLSSFVARKRDNITY